MKLGNVWLGLLAATAVFGQDAGMLQADASFARAIAKRDAAALDRMLDADFTWTDGAGKVLSKAQLLRAMPNLIIANVEGGDSKAYTYGELGDVQLNSGRAHVLRAWVKRSSGWKAIVYQEVMSLEAPPTFTPGAGTECENPCKILPFTPKSDSERQVALAYSKLETAAHARNSAAFAPMVADEFIAISSNSNKVQTKRSRIDEFDHAKDAGVAPTPLVSARMFDFGDAVLMLSEHKPDRGKPLRVARIWVKRDGNWVEALSYQTSIVAPVAH